MKMSKIVYADNVEGATRSFHAKIIEAINNNGILCDELADMFVITFVKVSDGMRAIINWA